MAGNFVPENHEKIKNSEEKYRAVIETLDDGFWIVDLKGRILEVNDVYCRQSGYTREELLLMRISDFEVNLDPEGIAHYLDKVRIEGHDRFESLHKTKGGKVWPVELVINFWPINEGLLFVFIHDIMERKKIGEEIRLMASVFQNSLEAILISDSSNRIINVNSAFKQLTGYSYEDVFGKDPKILSAGKQSRAFYQEMWRKIDQEGIWQGEIWDKRKDGTEYPKWLSITTVHNEQGEITNYIGNFSDITERKRIENEMFDMAYHDTLTGLHNRTSLILKLEQELIRAHRSSKRLAVMFIDLDRFKAINDTLGHHIGDNLLIEVGRRLTSAIRESDIVARLGGDEFVVLLTDIHGREEAELVAGKIIHSISLPYEIEDHKVYTSPSIGIGMYPEDGINSSSIMQAADMAMYFAKTEGGSKSRFFDPGMNSITREHLKIENELRQSLENDEFHLYFQPLMSKLGQVVGVEALIRWHHPQMGIVSPDRFIYIAEESGLILHIGRWVLEKACHTLKEWSKRGINGIIMSVNLSSREFLQDNFTETIVSIIESAGIHPQNLELEITESTAMKNPEKVLKVMKSLKSHNIRLSIDDFGTGYSSLAYLARFPIDQIKIDQTFIRDFENDSTVMAITLSTIALGRQLGIQVVVEGVETSRQSEILFKQECDLQQGYYFCKPVPDAEIMAYIFPRIKHGRTKGEES